LGGSGGDVNDVGPGRDSAQKSAVPGHVMAEEVVREAAALIARSISPLTKIVKITVAGLERSLIPCFDNALGNSKLAMVRGWTSPCGMYVYDGRGTNLQPDAPGGGNCPPAFLAGVGAVGGIRLLVQSDAELIDSRWEYSSAGSLQTIRGLIGSKKGCCLGVETAEDGQLVAWVLQYLDGSIGMLWCECDHRRSGLAGSLLSVATERCLKSGGDGFAYAHVVEGNRPSEGLFRKLGWKQASSADWVGYSGRFAALT